MPVKKMPGRDRAKLFSISLFIAGLIALLCAGEPAIETAHGFSSGPPDGRTGAPGESTCVECHLGSLNSGEGQFTITAPSSYAPGQTYQITVTHTTEDKTRLKWGFELTALTGSNTRAGTLQVTPLTIVIDNGGPDSDRQYIEHNSAGTFEGQGGGASWTFNWVAPATDVGTVTFYAAGNQANSDFTSFGDQIYTTTASISSAPACTYSLSPASHFSAASASSGSVQVTAGALCDWTATSNASWITIVSGETGTGGDTVNFELRENFTGIPRQGTLQIGGQIFNVIQDGGQSGCSYSISPLFTTFPASGGAATITVGAGSNCAWQATSSASWLSITGGSPAIGNGAVSYSVAPNMGPAGRKATIRIGNRIFAVKQRGE